MSYFSLLTVCIMTGVAGGYASTKQAATGIAIVPIIFLFMGCYSAALTPLPSMYSKPMRRFSDSPLGLLADYIVLSQFPRSVRCYATLFVDVA